MSKSFVGLCVRGAIIFLDVLCVIIEFFYGFQNTYFPSLLLLMSSVFLVVLTRKNLFGLIISTLIAYANYSIVFAEYLHKKSDTIFTQYIGTPEWHQAIYVLLFFMVCLIIMMPNSIEKFSANLYRDYWRAKILDGRGVVLVALLDIVLVAILIFGFARPTVVGDRGAPSAIYEYSMILFIISYFFGGENRVIWLLTSLILAAFCFQNFVYGGRITGIQLLIIFYVMNIEAHLSVKKILPVVVVLFILSSIIGVARGAWITGGVDVKYIIGELKDNLFTLDTAYSAFHTSLTFLMSEKWTTAIFRHTMFFNFLKASILGNYNTVAASVTRFTSQYYLHYDGGILPFVFHFYFGWSGVLIIAAYVGGLLRFFMTNMRVHSGLTKCLLVYFCATTFRWYLYTPIQLTRGLLLVAICYTGMQILIGTNSSNNGMKLNLQ
jgi:hypothetical protein